MYTRNGEVRGLAKELVARARRDVVADVDVARRHDAVKRGPDDLEGFERLERIHVRLVSDHRRLVFVISVRGDVTLLGANDLLIKKVLLALEGDPGQLKLRLGHLELRLRLSQFLIHLRGIDLSQDLARLDLGADVKVPGLQVSASLSENRCVSIRLRVARQLERDRLRNFLRMDYAHLHRWLMRNGRRRSRLGGSHLPFQKTQRYYQDGCHRQEEQSPFLLPGFSGNRFLGSFSCLIVRSRIHVGVHGA